MNVLVESTYRTCSTIYFEMSCEQVSANIGIELDERAVRVVCKNSTHRVWRGAGRRFVSCAAAFSAYKSGEMRAMIEAARELVNASALKSQPIPEPAVR